MKRLLFALVVVLLSFSSDSSEGQSVVKVVGGFGAYFQSLEILDDGGIKLSAGQEDIECGQLGSTEMDGLRNRIDESIEVLIVGGVVTIDQSQLHDHTGVSLLVRSFVGPDGVPYCDCEIDFPTELFPVRLLPLLNHIDDLGVGACGEDYLRVVPRDLRE